MIFQTTTAVDIDEELLNRCIVLTVDEGREQTRAIHERQRMAEDIHDGPAQVLTNAIFQVEYLDRMLKPSEDAVHAELSGDRARETVGFVEQIGSYFGFAADDEAFTILQGFAQFGRR